MSDFSLEEDENVENGRLIEGEDEDKPKNKKCKSVVKPWLSKISMMMQTVVLTMLRGCDGTKKGDPSKYIVRELRQVILENAGGNGSSYMDLGNQILIDACKAFFEDIDSYPMHFIIHFAHATEIVGYKHPDEKVREFWKGFYFDLYHTIHLNPEKEQQMDKRLIDGRDETVHGNLYNLIKDWKDSLKDFPKSSKTPELKTPEPIYSGRYDS